MGKEDKHEKRWKVLGKKTGKKTTFTFRYDEKMKLSGSIYDCQGVNSCTEQPG